MVGVIDKLWWEIINEKESICNCEGQTEGLEEGEFVLDPENIAYLWKKRKG